MATWKPWADLNGDSNIWRSLTRKRGRRKALAGSLCAIAASPGRASSVRRAWIRRRGEPGLVVRDRPAGAPIAREQDPSRDRDHGGGRDQQAEREQERRLAVHRRRGYRNDSTLGRSNALGVSTDAGTSRSRRRRVMEILTTTPTVA